MNISEPFIRRPVGTSLLAMGLFIMGIVAYGYLPVASMPRVDSPVIYLYLDRVERKVRRWTGSAEKRGAAHEPVNPPAAGEIPTPAQA